MKIRTEKMTSSEIKALKEILVERQHLLKKIIVAVCVLFLFIFFMPPRIYSLLSIEKHIGSHLFRFEIDRLFFYFIIAPSIIFYLIYAYLFKIPKIKADLKHETKEIGIIHIRSVRLIQEHDHQAHNCVLEFEKSSFKIARIFFSKHKEPELYHAKAFKFQVSKFAKVELKREIVQ